jgi:hypothetical protein
VTVAPVPDRIVSGDLSLRSPVLLSPLFFTASGNELVVAFISTGGPAGTQQAVTGVIGAGLSWSLAARANTTAGTAEVWQAWAPNPLIAASITATLRAAAAGSITIVSFSGAAHAVGATAIGSSQQGRAHVSIATTRAGSVIWAVGNNASHATAPTVSPDQSVVHQFADVLNNRTSWTQSTSPVQAPGTVVDAGVTAPIADAWDLAAVEVLPA